MSLGRQQDPQSPALEAFSPRISVVGDKEMRCAPRTVTSGSLQKTQRGIFWFNLSGSYLPHQVETDSLGSCPCSARATPLKSGAINT